MKTVFFTFALAATISAATAAETFTGVITDTMCGAKHGMMKNQPDDQCIKVCVKGPYQYALFDGTKVLKLSDQKTSAKFAAQRVKVTGTYDNKAKLIKVASIEPINKKGESK
jgi:phosphate-selective porin